jgi:hypothetical protein
VGGRLGEAVHEIVSAVERALGQTDGDWDRGRQDRSFHRAPLGLSLSGVVNLELTPLLSLWSLALGLSLGLALSLGGEVCIVEFGAAGLAPPETARGVWNPHARHERTPAWSIDRAFWAAWVGGPVIPVEQGVYVAHGALSQSPSGSVHPHEGQYQPSPSTSGVSQTSAESPRKAVHSGASSGTSGGSPTSALSIGGGVRVRCNGYRMFSYSTIVFSILIALKGI